MCCPVSLRHVISTIFFIFFASLFHDSTFSTYSTWKWIVKTKVRNFEDNAWADYCVNHPSMHIAQACLKNITPCQFKCLADKYPDHVSRIHIQIRIMGNFGPNGGVPWHVGTNGFLCLICKQGTEDVTHFLLDCPFFKENVDSVWLNIKARITETNPLDGTQICNFISNLDGESKVLLLLGGLPLPFDNATASSFIINSYYTIIKYKIVVKKDKRIQCF